MRTQHLNLFVFERGLLDFKLKYHPTSLWPKNINLDIRIGMKLSYLQRYIGHQVEELYKIIQREICELNARTVMHTLTFAKLYPKDFGFVYHNKPGYYGVVRGEVIYLKECSPQLVMLRSDDECYQDISILYNNRSMLDTKIKDYCSRRSPYRM